MEGKIEWQWREVVWYNVFILLSWHAAAVYTAVYVIPQLSLAQVSYYWWGLWFISGLGITAGAHRLWSHQSYRATRPLEIFLMFCNCMAFQGSIFEWSRDHRAHHRSSETHADPHNATRGFFFSHVGWVMLKKHPDVKAQKINMSDLAANPVVSIQKRFYLPLVLFWCYAFPALSGVVLFQDRWMTGFLVGGIFRHVWVLHMTWLVNSLAHLYGDRPYAPHISPAENLLVSIAAIGEGWHNYHHKFPRDYATSEWGITSGQWNPTKLFIDLCAYFHLAYDLKRSKTAPKIRLQNQSKLATPTASPTDRFFNKLFFGREQEHLF